MRPVAIAVAVGAAVLVVAIAGRTADAPRLRLDAAPVSPPLLAIRSTYSGAQLVTVDAATLAPRALPPLELGFYSMGWSFSADRSRLALGDGAGRLLVVDPNDLRRSWSFDPGGPAALVASSWDGDRLLTVSRTPMGVVARTIDWPRRRVTATARLRGGVQAVAHDGSTIVLLLAPLRGLRAARLAVVGSDSHVRTLSLERIRIGSKEPDSDAAQVQVVQHADAGLAVGNRHAYVVAAGAPVADVELRSLHVSYHELRQRSSFAARFAGWLQPAAHAKGALNGPNRSAVWLGDGTLAIVGSDDHGSVDRRGRATVSVSAAGLTVADTRTWRATVLERSASDVEPADGSLVVFGAAWDGRRRRETGMGLRVFDGAGRERFHLLGTEPIWDVQVIGRRAVLSLSARSGLKAAVVDLESGRLLSRDRDWPLRFLVGEPLPS